MFQHILVPLDGSERAEDALPVAARIARATGGSLHLLQVVSFPIDYGGWSMVPLMTEGFIESETASATSYLQIIATRAELQGVRVTTEVEYGIPTQSILAVAGRNDIDLIVMCSHGRTGFTRWMLGSVAYTLAHESTVPVLILREQFLKAHLLESDGSHPLRVLVPLDGSSLSEAALSPAIHLVEALAEPHQGILHLTKVIEPIAMYAKGGFASDMDEEMLYAARKYMAKVIEDVQVAEPKSTLSLNYSVELESDVAHTLVKLAEGSDTVREKRNTEDIEHYDLIAMSTHGRNGLQRWVMGSVTDRVLNSTQLPMLIVRPQQ